MSHSQVASAQLSTRDRRRARIQIAATVSLGITLAALIASIALVTSEKLDAMGEPVATQHQRHSPDSPQTAAPLLEASTEIARRE